MTVHFTCPSCGHNSTLRLEGASRNPGREDVAWYTVSCTRCQMVFTVVWTRDRKNENDIFPNIYRMREESGIWEGVP